MKLEGAAPLRCDAGIAQYLGRRNSSRRVAGGRAPVEDLLGARKHAARGRYAPTGSASRAIRWLNGWERTSCALARPRIEADSGFPTAKSPLPLPTIPNFTARVVPRTTRNRNITTDSCPVVC